MKVQCPQCSTSYRLPKGKAPAGGFKVRCKNCGHVIDVAAGESDAAEGEARWFVAVGNDKQGPLTLDEVTRRLDAGELASDTLVWRKGFKTWTRIAEVDEFQDRFEVAAGIGDEPTQLMPLAGVGAERPTGGMGGPSDSEGGEPHGADGETSEGGTPEPMVWQRRETSVLFSLDDYKVRKRTQQQPAIAQPETVIPVASTPASGVAEPARPAAQKAGMISLDASEIRHVAEALARRKQQRRIALMVVVGVAVVAVVAAGAYLFVTRAPSPAEEVPAQVALAPEVAPAPVVVQTPEPAPAAEPAQEAPEPAPAAEPAAEVAQEVAPAEPAKPVQRPVATPRDPRKPREAAPAPTPAPATAPEPKPAAKPASPTVVDANTLLAQYKGGKGGGDAAKGGDGGSAAADSNLPAQLTMAQVASVLRRKQGAVDSCVKSNNVSLPARANTRVVIEGSGRVVSASSSGAGAADSCIEGVLRSVQFPKFKGDPMTVPFPFTVR